jgi:hypothetical protein
MPTAVQFPIAFGHFNHRNDPFVVNAAGNVLHVHLTQ